MENNKVDEVTDEIKWVRDSSLDHKGKVPLRDLTGSWKASLFIVGKEKYLHPALIFCFFIQE